MQLATRRTSRRKEKLMDDVVKLWGCRKKPGVTSDAAEREGVAVADL